MATTPDRPPRVGAPTLDLIIAVCVVLISVASLWLAVRSGQIQERTLAASVWPYLEHGSSDITENGDRIILFTIKNKGVGPALLHWFTLSYRGQEFSSAGKLLRECCNFSGIVITSSIHDRVIAARESIDYIKVLPASMSLDQYHRIDKAIPYIEARGCYCSVLDQCWMIGPSKEQPVPIASCPPSPVRRDRF